MLLRGGRVVAEGWWAPYAADRAHLLYSLSKSFTSTALALAVGDGLVDLDGTVLGHFPELDARIADPRSRRMLVRHVAAMASGHRDDVVTRALAADPDDLVHGFLSVPPDADPGSLWAYNQPCTFTVGAVVQRVTGGSLSALLADRFPPFAAAPTGWLTDRGGREIGWSGLHATTETVAALGQLYLQDGVWEGRRVLPAGWVAEATRSHISTGQHPEGHQDWEQGYGFQFWMARHGYRGDGAFGQYCIVLPEQDTVLAITSQTPQMQSVLDLVWEYLLPALGAAGSPATDTDLAAHLEALVLPLPTSDGPIDPAITGSFSARDGNDQPGLTAVRLHPAGGGWTVGLVEGADTLTMTAREGAWTVTDAMATAVAGSGSDLQVDVVLVETPHRLSLFCHPGDGTFTARWQTVPLHNPPLRDLRLPDPARPATEFTR
nr:serine hydrolase domain-containing protein [Nakamurella flavida]